MTSRATPPAPPESPDGADGRASGHDGASRDARSQGVGFRPHRTEVVSVSPRDRWFAAALLLAALGALAVVWKVNPSQHPNLPECPTLGLLGVYCPGCGSTRATHHLLNGRLATAWSFNPLMVLVGAPLGIAYAAALASAILTGRRPMWRPPARLAYAIAVLLLLYMGVRNIPGTQFDWLRPPERVAR